MQRRTRNRICIWLICVGLLNFAAYTIIYGQLGGDAHNGGIERIQSDDGEGETVYFIEGHFIHGPAGRRTNVPFWIWIYSYFHSISLWPTMGIVMICMLTLARPHIIATMRESTWIRGPTFITVAVTLIAAFCSAMTIWFALGFAAEFSRG